MENNLEKLFIDLRRFLSDKRFATRGGIPITKKMWREGYNKALDDVENFILMQNEDQLKGGDNK